MHGPTWTLPGGGIEADESAEACARREIFEETGYQYSGELTRHWYGTIEFSHQGKSFKVHEQYFFAPIQKTFKPTTSQMMDYEKDFTLDIAWCSLKQLEQQHCSPRQVPRMLKQVTSDVLPQESEHSSILCLQTISALRRQPETTPRRQPGTTPRRRPELPLSMSAGAT